MKVKMELKGIEALQDLLRDLALAGESAAEATAVQLARDVRDIAVRNMRAAAGSAPAGSYPNQQSGRLARSVFAETRGHGVAAVGSTEIHGYYLEFGTESMAARPWLVPSFEEATRDAAAKLAAQLMERI